MKNLLLGLLFAFPLASIAGKVEPQYLACQGQEVVRTSSDHDHSLRPAPRKKRPSLEELSFKKHLSEKVVDRIEKKLFEFQSLRACFGSDKEGTDFCRDVRDVYRENLKTYWHPMRVNLALSRPRLRGIDYSVLKTSTSYWYDKKPTHIVSGLSVLSPLTDREIEEAQDVFIEQVLSFPFRELFTAEELKKILLSKQFTRLGFGEARATEEIYKVRARAEKLRESAKQEYFKILGNLPVLSYLESERDINDDKKLFGAFLKVENHLKELLSKIESGPEKKSEDILLSFAPLVEDVLSHRPELCSVAENIRLRVSKRSTAHIVLHVVAGVASAVPCFFPGGAVLCLMGGLGVGGYGLYHANDELNLSKQRVLTGEDIQKFADLEARERGVILEKVLLPLAFWGTTAQSLVALRNTVNKAAIKKQAGAVLNRPVTTGEAKTIVAAHNVGRGELGIDGQPAGIGSYTPIQLLTKSKTLSSSGFTRQERRRLIEAGVVGRVVKPKIKDILPRLKGVVKPDRQNLIREFAVDCGPRCFELKSKASGAVFRVEVDSGLSKPLIAFSEDFQVKTLRVPENFFTDSSIVRSENFLRRWLIGHELHPYNSVVRGNIMEKPVQRAALKAYERAKRNGHKSFLHVAPTAVGKGRVLSQVLLKRLSKMEEGKKVVLVTVDRIHLVDQLSKNIENILGR